MPDKQDIAFKAMSFAREAHGGHVRKYTGNPYTDHLAEVAGIVATVNPSPEAIAISWLHDCVEDVGVTEQELTEKFTPLIASGVMFLSDLEEGNRETRKRLSRERLFTAPRWIQTIKVADLISNTASIVEHDPKFAKIYLEEKRLLLRILNGADQRLLDIATNQVSLTPSTK